MIPGILLLYPELAVRTCVERRVMGEVPEGVYAETDVGVGGACAICATPGVRSIESNVVGFIQPSSHITPIGDCEERRGLPTSTGISMDEE